jgi:hypothetical protein
MMASVVGTIQDIVLEVGHIPRGCTSICQQVDIGVNKPFKNRLCQQWEDGMIEEGQANGTTSPPSREDMHDGLGMVQSIYQVRLSKMLGNNAITPGFHQQARKLPT